MKKITFFICFLFCTFFDAFSQMIVKDDAMAAQERRQVYLKWGDWKPDAKYIFGAQVNQLHSLVWGWSAPSRNRTYKNSGNDIRPLKATGKQNLRLAALAQQNAIMEDIVKESNEIGSLAEQEILYYSNTTAKIDPLYQFYFKKTLKPIYEFQLSDVLAQCKSVDVYNYLKEIGIIDIHVREMNILKERLDGLFNTNIERGQRIIGYHKILNDYRGQNETFNSHVSTTRRFLSMKARNVYQSPKDIDNSNAYNGDQYDRDRQITREVMETVKYNSKFN